jgi:hypothetical protein
MKSIDKMLRFMIKFSGWIILLFLSILFLIILYIVINNKLNDDFVSGKTGEISKILLKKGGKEIVIDDEDLMDYLENAFKTLKPSQSNPGVPVPAIIYFKYRPKIYVVIFISELKFGKVNIWIDGDDGHAYEFKLEKPIPNSFFKIIDFLKE